MNALSLSSISSPFSLDPRSLRLFRMGLGIMILWDLYQRSQDLVAHYSDQGVLPREALFEQVWYTGLWSFHTWFGDRFSVIVLFSLASLFAIFMILDVWPRLSSLLSWIFLLSLQARNPLVLQGGDTLLRVLLFWNILIVLLPKHQRFSVPAMGLVLQIVFLYLFAGWLKNGIEWEEGTAVYYALNLDMHSTSLGKKLLAYPTLMQGLSYYSLYLERWGILLLLIPFWNHVWRYLCMGLFVSLHVGFAFCLELGLFSYIGIAAWLAVLPPHFWEKGLGKKISTWLKSVPTRTLPFVKKLAPILAPASQVIAIISLIGILGWNLLTVGIDYLPRFADNYLLYTRISQEWDLFAPSPMKNDGWYVVQAHFSEGQEKDLLAPDQQLSWKKPPHVAAHYANNRWRKYLKNIKRRQYKDLKPYWAAYYCDSWNAQQASPKLELIRIYFMLERTPPLGDSLQVDKKFIWKQDCP